MTRGKKSSATAVKKGARGNKTRAAAAARKTTRAAGPRTKSGGAPVRERAGVAGANRELSALEALGTRMSRLGGKSRAKSRHKTRVRTGSMIKLLERVGFRL